MKTKRILLQSFFALALMALSGFTSSTRIRNSNFTISLSNYPVQGNTEYDLTVGYAVGNTGYYQLIPYTGFYIIGGDAKDISAGQNTVFRIKTYPNVYYISGNVIATDCIICQPVGSKSFSF